MLSFTEDCSDSNSWQRTSAGCCSLRLKKIKQRFLEVQGRGARLQQRTKRGKTGNTEGKRQQFQNPCPVGWQGVGSGFTRVHSVPRDLSQLLQAMVQSWLTVPSTSSKPGSLIKKHMSLQIFEIALRRANHLAKR